MAGFASGIVNSWASFLLVKTGWMGWLILRDKSLSCLRTLSADLWSLNGNLMRTGSGMLDLCWLAHRALNSWIVWSWIFQRVDEHRYSVIGKHYKDQHQTKPFDILGQFSILKKCRGKFDCLLYEMLFIRTIKPTLNTQGDSVKAKLFISITITITITITIIYWFVRLIISCRWSSFVRVLSS